MKNYLMLLLFCILTACGMESYEGSFNDMNEDAKTQKIADFWTWFDANKSEFEDLESKSNQKLDSIIKRLSTIEPELSIEISNEKEGLREIVITPEGIREKFEIVEQIVSLAPVIEGWKVVAFRQPIGEDFMLQYGDLELTPSNLYFFPIETDGSLDIIIYGDGFGDHEEDVLNHYGLIMIDNILGEYNFVTQVRYCDFQELPDESERSGLLPLSQLRAFIDSRK